MVAQRDESGIVKSLVAFATNKLTDAEIQQLSDSCSGRIESLFFPKEFLFVEEIPTTISGKVDRTLLEKIAAETKKN